MKLYVNCFRNYKAQGAGRGPEEQARRQVLDSWSPLAGRCSLQRARRDKTQGTTCPNHVIDGSHHITSARRLPRLPPPWPMLLPTQGHRHTAPFLLQTLGDTTRQDRTSGQPLPLVVSRPDQPACPPWLVGLGQSRLQSKLDMHMRASFSFEKFGTVAFSFVCDKYYLIMD